MIGMTFTSYSNRTCSEQKAQNFVEKHGKSSRAGLPERRSHSETDQEDTIPVHPVFSWNIKNVLQEERVQFNNLQREPEVRTYHTVKYTSLRTSNIKKLWQCLHDTRSGIALHIFALSPGTP